MKLKQISNRIFSQGPSDVLTLILGPSFIVYGAGLLQGYRETLISVLGLPAYAYALMFIVAGVLKLCGLVFDWGRLSHTIGVTVASFWAAVILILSPSVGGWVGALPWICIALIAFFAAVWPDQMSTELVVPKILDETDPHMQAIDYLSKDRTSERRDNDYPR